MFLTMVSDDFTHCSNFYFPLCWHYNMGTYAKSLVTSVKHQSLVIKITLYKANLTISFLQFFF